MIPYKCLLAPDAPLATALVAMCCLALILILAGVVLCWRAMRALRNLVETDGLMFVYPDRADHMRRR